LLPRDKLDRLRLDASAVEKTPSGKLIVAASKQPGAAVLVAYRSRLARIDAALSAPLDELRRLVARLFLLFPQSNVAPQASVEAYASVLADRPLWAIERAFNRVRQSGAAFRPSAPELWKLATDECSALLEERDLIATVLDAEPYEDRGSVEREKSRARVKSGFQSLKAALGAVDLSQKAS
jgi:hypothetical protein